MKIYAINTILFIFFGSLYAAHITEISSLKDLLPIVDAHKDQKILVLFDIDDTLARGKEPIGTDAFFSARVTQFMHQGMDVNSAISHSLPDYFYVQFYMPLVLIEPDTLAVLNFLKNNSISYMGLTARSLYIAERTLDQLRAIDISFNFFAHEKISLNLAHPSLFKQGILFCGLNDKGDALLSFLDRVDVKPDLIVFIDDKHKNLVSVEMALLNRQICFEGLRLGVCDEFVRHFNLAKAEEELIAFKAKMSSTPYALGA